MHRISEAIECQLLLIEEIAYTQMEVERLGRLSTQSEGWRAETTHIGKAVTASKDDYSDILVRTREMLEVGRAAISEMRTEMEPLEREKRTIQDEQMGRKSSAEALQVLDSQARGTVRLSCRCE